MYKTVLAEINYFLKIEVEYLKIRERYVATVLYQDVDRVPFFPGRARKSTRKNWYKQGLPEGEEWFDYLTKILGIETEWLYSEINPGINFRIIPEFEEKVLERKERTLVVQDWKGNICEISNEFDVSYLRNPIDFVTRKWIKCPVEGWKDWEQMKTRYNPKDPIRFPEDFKERCSFLSNQERVVSIWFDGLFMQLREWMGFEGLCIAFIESPDLVKDMINFWCEYVSVMLDKSLNLVKPDYVHISEDMAYKHKSMISPEMTREFFLPSWRQWGEIIHNSGCPIFDIDSDGYIGELIPIWIEAGFDINDPVEIAAGNALYEYKQKFDNKMAYLGGVDKREIAKGKDAIKTELERLKPIIKSGGFIPSCDHGIPADVSWPNMVEYVKQLAKATGWL